MLITVRSADSVSSANIALQQNFGGFQCDMKSGKRMRDSRS